MIIFNSLNRLCVRRTLCRRSVRAVEQHSSDLLKLTGSSASRKPLPFRLRSSSRKIPLTTYSAETILRTLTRFIRIGSEFPRASTSIVIQDLCLARCLAPGLGRRRFKLAKYSQERHSAPLISLAQNNKVSRPIHPVETIGALAHKAKSGPTPAGQEPLFGHAVPI